MLRTLVVTTAAISAAGTALAQSSVTVYGRLNVTLERQTLNGITTKVENNNASRIGFRGIEDLGDGLKGGFWLEHGFSPDTGSQTQPAFWARRAQVSIEGRFGAFRMGRFTSEAYYATSDYIGLHNHETGTSADALYAYVGRNTNKVAYRSPELVTGLTLEGAVSAPEGALGQRPSYDLALNWLPVPAFHLGLGYEKNDTAHQVVGAALYKIGSFVFGGLVQRDTNGWRANVGDRTSLRGSAAYILGANEFHLNYGHAGDYSKLDGSKGNQLTVAYNYNLSRRTKVYAYYTKTEDPKKIYAFAGDFKSFALGVRHNF